MGFSPGGKWICVGAAGPSFKPAIDVSFVPPNRPWSTEMAKRKVSLSDAEIIQVIADRVKYKTKAECAEVLGYSGVPALNNRIDKLTEKYPAHMARLKPFEDIKRGPQVEQLSDDVLDSLFSQLED